MSPLQSFLLILCQMYLKVYGHNLPITSQLSHNKLDSEKMWRLNTTEVAVDCLWQNNLTDKPTVENTRDKRDVPIWEQKIAAVKKSNTMPGIITSHGYPAQVHHVTTKDGYILELHRIPGPRAIKVSPLGKRRYKRRVRHSTGSNSNSNRALLKRRRKLIQLFDPQKLAEYYMKKRGISKHTKLNSLNVIRINEKEQLKRSVNHTKINRKGYKNSNDLLFDDKMEKSKNTMKHKSVTNKKVVFLQHCLQCSSADFVRNDHNEALGFMLADAGYDVWLGNFRGNEYSRRHESLSSQQLKFWKFNVDDLAKYDLPAMVDYVLNVTKTRDLYYIGHSLGTMTFFMAASTNQNFQSKIKLMVALAPSGYLDHMGGVLRPMVTFAAQYYKIMEVAGFGSVGGFLSGRRKFLRRVCHPSSVLSSICSNILRMVGSGLHDKNYIPLLAANLPSGTSIRIMAQIGQFLNSDGIRKFDYGRRGLNLLHYGDRVPPHYPLEKIGTKIAIFWSEDDHLVTPQDVSRTVSRLPRVIYNHKIPHYNFNHLDFLYADVASEMVYKPILQLLQTY